MNLLGKKIENVSEDDIKRLVSNGVSESKTLDYKRELKIETGDDRKEFLYDIASLANTEGGAIVYGIEEQKDSQGQNTGIPSQITGITIHNKDKLIQKVEDLAKNNIEPHLNSLNIKHIIVDGLEILIIGVPKKIGMPHMVTYNSTNKFYKRRNSGKYLLDVHELNNSFLNSFTIKEAANNFREQRIQEVRELKFLPKLDIIGSYFLHVIPLGHLGESIIDISDEEKLNFLLEKLKPHNSKGYDYRYNLDGLIIFAADRNNKIPYSYIQFFRNGTLEFYTSHLHFPKKNEPDKLDFYGQSFEYITLRYIQTAFDVLKYYQVEPPFAVFISLFDLDNAVVHTQNQNMWMNATEVIGKNQLLFPAVVFDDTTQDISKKMKSTFDILWQAGNFTKSPFYNDNSDKK